MLSDHQLIWRTLLQGRETKVMESLARWVADEYQSKRQEQVDTSDWPRHYLRVRHDATFLLGAADNHGQGPT